MALRHSTLVYILNHGSTSLYLILDYYTIALLDATLFYHGSTLLYVILHYSTMALLQSSLLYITLAWLYFTLLDSTFPTFALLHSTWF